MIYLIIALSILCIILLYGLFRLLKNYELLEEKYEDMGRLASSALNEMKAIDIRGSFEADDEVGAVFKDMKEIVELFNKTYDNT